jgi:hypothetical protein
LAFAVVDNTAVYTFSPVLFSSFFKNSGYLYNDGLALDTKLNDLGTLRSLFSPTRAVGVRLRDKKFNRGYQYQYYVNITNPTTAFYLKFPSLVVNDIVAFLPAEFIIPYAKIAPILDSISSCLSSIILLYSFLIVATLGSYVSVICTNTKLNAINAPYLTKST